MKKLGIRQSVGRTGICYDNAMAESFFATLKNERVHRTVYPTREHARNDIARYIETRYTQGEKAKDCTYNLRLAASRLDGAVVMPGGGLSLGSFSDGPVGSAGVPSKKNWSW